MDYVFTQEELQYLDDQMPEVLRREKEDDVCKVIASIAVMYCTYVVDI